MKSFLILLLSVSLAAPGMLCAEEEPDLPASDQKVEEAPEPAGDVKEVETPHGEVPRKDSVVATPVKPARFRFKNLIIGALSGAVIGTGIAILFFSQDPKTQSIDRDRLPTTAGIGAGIGAAAGGTLGFLLGATTPTGPLPPEMQTGLEGPQFAGIHVGFSVKF